jgi:hypothetical protein
LKKNKEETVKQAFFCFFLFVGSFQLPAQDISCSMPCNTIGGVSCGYSYRPLFIFGNSTEKTMFPAHVVFLNLDGMVSVNSGSGSFGGLGIVFGFSAADKASPFDSDKSYYMEHYRITGLNTQKNDALIIAGNLRMMGLFDFSSENSLSDSYYDISLEAGYMGLSYDVVAGAFNKYVVERKQEGGFYGAINFGLKIVIFEAYGGLGGLSSFYSKGLTFTSDDDDDDDDGDEISNNPKTTNHFICYFGAGLVFDLHSLENM